MNSNVVSRFGLGGQVDGKRNRNVISANPKMPAAICALLEAEAARCTTDKSKIANLKKTVAAYKMYVQDLGRQIRELSRPR